MVVYDNWLNKAQLLVVNHTLYFRKPTAVLVGTDSTISKLQRKPAENKVTVFYLMNCKLRIIEYTEQVSFF